MADSFVYTGPHERLFLRLGVCLHRGVPVELDGDLAARAARLEGVTVVEPEPEPQPAVPVQPQPDHANPTAGMVRQWAREAQVPVPRKGRVPDDVTQAYIRAHRQG